MEGEKKSDQPLFSFGLLADVQYADIDDRQNYEKTVWRHYRQSRLLLEAAVNAWNNAKYPVSFLLQLGDLIDGFNTLSSNSEQALDTVLQILAQFQGTQGVHHTWGNHELYNFRHKSLMSSRLHSDPLCRDEDTHSQASSKSYYSFVPYPGWRVVILDTYEVSMLGRTPDEPQYQEALRMISAVNSNEDLNSPQGLEGLSRRFCQFNGAVSSEQIAWLDSLLTEADAHGEWVIIVGHIPVYEGASDSLCRLLNYDQVLSTLWHHSCVVLYAAGHDHDGGEARDPHGIQHLTLRGMVEAAADEDASATALVYQDHIKVLNIGSRKSPVEQMVIQLPNHTNSA